MDTTEDIFGNKGGETVYRTDRGSCTLFTPRRPGTLQEWDVQSVGEHRAAEAPHTEHVHQTQRPALSPRDTVYPTRIKCNQMGW